MNPVAVAITRRIHPIAREKLAQHFCVREWESPIAPTTTELTNLVSECAGAITMLSDSIDVQFFQRNPKLRVLANYAVGTNNIDLTAASQHGVRVGNTPDVLTEATAELAIALILIALRRIPEAMHAVACGKWTDWEPMGYLGRSLRGSTVGIVGYGRIGRRVAEILHRGWGVEILVHNRSLVRQTSIPLTLVTLDQLLAKSDIVSLHCPLTPRSRQMLNEAAFAKMKLGSTLVNTARGELVDPVALENALRSGHLFGAAMDVSDPEPMNSKNSLLLCKNFCQLPHIGSATESTRKQMAEIAADNIIGALLGTHMPAEVFG